MPRKKPKKRPTETLAQKHRRLVRSFESAGDEASLLQQPEPVMDAVESVRFVTIYGMYDLPV